MNMKSITKKKMGGFMCQSPAATAVCMTSDSRSAIVPGRRLVPADRFVTTTTNSSDHNTRLVNTAKYSRLVDLHHHHHESRRKLINIRTSTTNTSNSVDKKTVIFPSLKGEKALRIQGDQPYFKGEKALRIHGDQPSFKGEKALRIKGDQERSLQKPSALIDSLPDNVFQVVVMRVSLHCQGCAGKLKKHLSKMEGVTSFSIELETKRVTVMGHVSPVGVLESISKVRRAEFWPS